MRNITIDKLAGGRFYSKEYPSVRLPFAFSAGLLGEGFQIRAGGKQERGGEGQEEVGFGEDETN